MKLTNKTHWRTDDLRALIAAALDADGIGTQGMHVTVEPAKRSNRRWCSGYAWLRGSSIHVRVPQPMGEWGALPDHLRDDLARVVIHEAAHCRGVEHADMHGNLKRDWRGGTDDRDVSFAAAIWVRAKPVKVKSPVDHVARRAAHAAAKLAEAERRLKLARTIAAKWRAKVRYYERRAAAQGTVQP